MSLDGDDNGLDFVIAMLQQLDGAAGDRTVWDDDDEKVSGAMMTKKVSGVMMTKKQCLER